MSGLLETKNKILKSLSRKPKTGRQLADELGLSQPTLTQHLKELESRGLIKGADGSYSRRWKYYEVNAMEYEKFAQSRSAHRNAAAAFAAAVAVIMIAAFVAGRLSAPGAAGQQYNSTVPAAVTSSGSSTQPQLSNAIIPGGSTGAAFACPFIGYAESNITIDSVTGFAQYEVSNYTDLVIAPGSSGTIRYTVHVAPLPGNSNAVEPQTLTLSNLVSFAHEGRGGNSSVALTSYATPGINISYSPMNYTEPYPMSTQNFTFGTTLNVGRSAPKGTYWMTIATCEGYSRPMLMTVGSGPYNGTVNVVARIYA